MVSTYPICGVLARPLSNPQLANVILGNINTTTTFKRVFDIVDFNFSVLVSSTINLRRMARESLGLLSMESIENAGLPASFIHVNY